LRSSESVVCYNLQTEFLELLASTQVSQECYKATGKFQAPCFSNGNAPGDGRTHGIFLTECGLHIVFIYAVI
jgi:hypothetical protein